MSGYKSRYRQPPTAGAAGVSVVPYDMNPAGSSDVVMFFDFTETSGNLVDSVNNVTLQPAGSNTAQITYNVFNYPSVDNTSIYQNVVPGVGFKGVQAYLVDLAPSTNINPGTKDFTLELWYAAGPGRAAGNYILSLCNAAGVASTGGFLLTFGNIATGSVGYYLRATDGTTVNGTSAAPTKPSTWDGGLNKLRIVHDRTAAQLKIFVNEQAITPINAGTLAGKTIQFDSVYLNAAWTGGGEGAIPGYYGLRLSHNATNNAPGPDES